MAVGVVALLIIGLTIEFIWNKKEKGANIKGEVTEKVFTVFPAKGVCMHNLFWV